MRHTHLIPQSLQAVSALVEATQLEKDEATAAAEQANGGDVSALALADTLATLHQQRAHMQLLAVCFGRLYFAWYLLMRQAGTSA